MLSRATLDCERLMLSFCSQFCLERAPKRQRDSQYLMYQQLPLNCLVSLHFPSFCQRLFCEVIRMSGDCSGLGDAGEFPALKPFLAPALHFGGPRGRGAWVCPCALPVPLAWPGLPTTAGGQQREDASPGPAPRPCWIQ